MGRYADQREVLTGIPSRLAIDKLECFLRIVELIYPESLDTTAALPTKSSSNESSQGADDSSGSSDPKNTSEEQKKSTPAEKKVLNPACPNTRARKAIYRFLKEKLQETQAKYAWLNGHEFFEPLGEFGDIEKIDDEAEKGRFDIDAIIRREKLEERYLRAKTAGIVFKKEWNTDIIGKCERYGGGGMVKIRIFFFDVSIFSSFFRLFAIWERKIDLKTQPRFCLKR